MVTFNVALLAEGVDRNMEDLAAVKGKSNIVALLAEGVDRNLQGVVVQHGSDGSPSSRRAWIEMTSTPSSRKWTPRRPPRGGRG